MQITCEKNGDSGYQCTVDEDFATVNSIMIIIIVVILCLLAAWLLRGMTRGCVSDSLMPPTNLEPHCTITSEADFETAMKMGHPILALVSAPWCGHCKHFVPHFKKAALAVQQGDHNVTMAIIDGEAFRGIHDLVHIDGYPTCIQVWPDGTIDKHQPSARTADGVEHLAKAVAVAAVKSKAPSTSTPSTSTPSTSTPSTTPPKTSIS